MWRSRISRGHHAPSRAGTPYAISRDSHAAAFVWLLHGQYWPRHVFSNKPCVLCRTESITVHWDLSIASAAASVSDVYRHAVTGQYCYYSILRSGGTQLHTGRDVCDGRECIISSSTRAPHADVPCNYMSHYRRLLTTPALCPPCTLTFVRHVL